MMSKKAPLFKIIFFNEESLVEIYAREVAECEMFGFIVVEDFVFGERSNVVIDPSEEHLRNEFGGVKRTFIPTQSIIRIDEVEQEGHAKMTPLKEGGVNISPFPSPLMRKPKDKPQER